MAPVAVVHFEDRTVLAEEDVDRLSEVLAVFIRACVREVSGVVVGEPLFPFVYFGHGPGIALIRQDFKLFDAVTPTPLGMPGGCGSAAVLQ